MGYAQGVQLQLANIDNEDWLTTQGFVQMDETLSASTAYYAALNLAWEISPDGGVTWITPAVAESHNQTFVTLANPHGWDPAGNVEKPTVERTALFAGAQGPGGGNTATDTNSLVSMVWSAFATRAITDANSMPMTYWKSWDAETIASISDNLISSRDGNCIAWSRLFVDALRAWGGDFAYAANIKQVVVDQENTPVNATGFLVNNWAFGNQNVLLPPPPSMAGYLWYNEVGTPFAVEIASQMTYNWQGQAAVTYPGGSAQNNTNPVGQFGDHVFVRIGNVIYDPSYGVTYSSILANPADDDLLRAFETSSVAGYYWFPPVQGAIGAPRVYFRPVTIPDVPFVKLTFSDRVF